MRFHTSLTLHDIRSVELPPGVHWHHVREYGSRSRARAFEIVLEGTSCYGGQFGNRNYSAGTWDEWGVVLGRLFALDPNARVARVYEGAEHYHHVTGNRFDPDNLPERLCPRHKWGGWDRNYPDMSWCTKCDAVRRWDWRADPEPRDDTAAQRGPTTPEPGALYWIGSPGDFLAGRTTPPRTEVDTYGERYPRDDELGKYASGGKYAADLARNPVDLLDRIDELIKEGS